MQVHVHDPFLFKQILTINLELWPMPLYKAYPNPLISPLQYSVMQIKTFNNNPYYSLIQVSEKCMDPQVGNNTLPCVLKNCPCPLDHCSSSKSSLKSKIVSCLLPNLNCAAEKTITTHLEWHQCLHFGPFHNHYPVFKIITQVIHTDKKFHREFHQK